MNFEQHFTPIEESNPENTSLPVTNFNYEGKELAVSFIETSQVTDGVGCEVYNFSDDESKDLGIIKIDPGKKTPLQKVLKGEKTVEGYISGKGKLTITKLDGKQDVFVVDGASRESFATTVNIGEIMQWEADADSDLKVFEICFPPYEDGRFENIG